MTYFKKLLVKTLVFLLSMQSILQAASNLPTGGSFVSGSGKISASNNVLTINQNSLRGIIDWNTFSIAQGATVNIHNGAGATLNRVTGTTPTAILGQLLGSGNVYVINPEGVLIGRGSVVHTGGDFFASTLNLSNSSFLNSQLTGTPLKFTGSSTATVVNLGDITSSGGNIFLIGHDVDNSGSLTAPNGTAGLAAGSQVLITDSLSSQKVSVQAPGGDVTNSGFISAAQAELKSNGGNIYALAGNNGGQINATGTATRDGHVWLVATNGTTNVSGSLSASNANGTGGQIETSGAQVVTTGAQIKTAKGGSWLLDPTDLTIDNTLAATIESSLNNGTNVTEQTSASGTGGNGDITVASNIAWTTGANLTLSAYRNIGFNSGVVVSNSGTGSLTLRADNAATGVGSVNFSSPSQVNFSQSTGTVSLLYDPNSYVTPTVYASNVVTNPSWTAPASGSVSSQFTAYMLVNNTANLQEVSTNLAGTYALSQNIDISSVSNFSPLGSSSYFSGIFDGQNHTVNGLTIVDSTGAALGLFGGISSGGIVRNLNLTGVSITEYGSNPGSIGALAGVNQGTIANVAVAGSITTGSSPQSVGGLVGYNEGSQGVIEYSNSSVAIDATLATGAAFLGGLVGQNGTLTTITNSFATGIVNAPNSAGALVGGLSGDNSGPVTNSYATGNVIGGGAASSVGGFAGANNAPLTADYATGAVSAGPTSKVGGFVGDNSVLGNILGTITSSYATGPVSGTGSYAGGLVGFNEGSTLITGSYATGSVNDTAAYAMGGLVGYTLGPVTSSYSTGLVTGGNGAYLGGLVGYSDVGGVITTSYSTSNVTGGTSSYVGGLVGYSVAAVTGSNASGSVTGGDGAYVGGLAGKTVIGGTINLSYASGPVTGGASSLDGGLVGAIGDSITTSYAAGSVSGGNNSSVGGLVGYAAGDVLLSYALGNVSGAAGSNDGGLVGLADNPTVITATYAHGAATGGTNSNVGGLIGQNCAVCVAGASYSTGAVTGGSGSQLGGFAGLNNGTIAASYWDSQASGMSTGIGQNNGVSLLTSQTTAQLQSGTVPVGFTVSDWTAPSGSYPFLAWQGAAVTVSGTAFNSTGAALSSANVDVLSGGVSLATVTTNPSGVYSVVEPANMLKSTGLLTFLTSGGTANTYTDGTTGYSALDLYSGTFSLISGTATTLSGLTGSLSRTLGSVSGSNLLFAPLAGQLSLSSGNLSLLSYAPSFSVDVPLAGTGNVLLYSAGSMGIAGGAGISVPSGSNIKLIDTTSFTNSAGANALNVSGGGNWLVYSANPANDSTGGLTPGFIQYNATFPAAPAQSGNGLLYSLAPTLTVGLTGTPSKVYDGTTTATLSTSDFTSTGAIQNDVVNIASSAASYASQNVNTGIGVSATGLSVTASNGGIPVYGYQLASTTASANIGVITPATLTYTANSGSRDYGSSNPVLTGTVTGFVNGETLAGVTAGTTTFTTSATASSNVGTFAINGSGLTANNGNYLFVQAGANTSALSILPATLIYNATAASQTYGTNNNVFSGTVTGFVNGDTAASATSGTAVFNSSTTAASSVGSYSILGSGLTANNGNYVFIQNPANLLALTITPATLTYTAAPASQTYGTNNNLFTGTVTGFVNGDTAATATTGTPIFASLTTALTGVGTYAIHGTGLLANSGNYTFAQAAGNSSALTITPAPLYYTATAASQTYGSANTSFTGSVSGFVNLDTALTTTTGAASFNSTTSAATSVGSYAINGSGVTLTSNNYTLLQAPSNASALTINPATLTYTANPVSLIYGAATPTFAGSVSGFVNSQTLGTATTGSLTFGSSATPASYVGTYAINGSGLIANNGNYVFAQAAANTSALTINPATLTYTATAATQSSGTVNNLFTGTVNGFVNGDTLASSTTGAALFASLTTPLTPAGSYAINGAGLIANHGNYVFTEAASNSTALSITAAATSLNISINPVVTVSGQATPAFSATYSGPAIAGVNIASILDGLTYQISPALNGPGTYKITASGTAPSGFSLNIPAATFTVLDDSAATVPTQTKPIPPETPALFSVSAATPEASFLAPVNALGLFQINTLAPAGANGFGVTATADGQPLAQSSFFSAAGQQPVTVVAGAKAQ